MTRWILVRHAHAEAAAPSDLERRLDDEGRKEARAMGVWLRQEGWIPDRVVCSPAIRARQTVEQIVAGAEADPDVEIVEALYLGASRDYLRALERAEVESIMLVGHLPTIHEVVDQLAPDASRTASGKLMTTGAAACFEDRRLVHLMRPKQLPVQGAARS